MNLSVLRPPGSLRIWMKQKHLKSIQRGLQIQWEWELLCISSVPCIHPLLTGGEEPLSWPRHHSKEGRSTLLLCQPLLSPVLVWNERRIMREALQVITVCLTGGACLYCYCFLYNIPVLETIPPVLLGLSVSAFLRQWYFLTKLIRHSLMLGQFPELHVVNHLVIQMFAYFSTVFFLSDSIRST